MSQLVTYREGILTIRQSRWLDVMVFVVVGLFFLGLAILIAMGQLYPDVLPILGLGGVSVYVVLLLFLVGVGLEIVALKTAHERSKTTELPRKLVVTASELIHWPTLGEETYRYDWQDIRRIILANKRVNTNGGIEYISSPQLCIYFPKDFLSGSGVFELPRRAIEYCPDGLYAMVELPREIEIDLFAALRELSPPHVECLCGDRIVHDARNDEVRVEGDFA